MKLLIVGGTKYCLRAKKSHLVAISVKSPNLVPAIQKLYLWEFIC